MFPEYRDLITKIKGQDGHFTRLFDKHNELDQLIKNMEAADADIFSWFAGSKPVDPVYGVNG